MKRAEVMGKKKKEEEQGEEGKRRRRSLSHSSSSSSLSKLASAAAVVKRHLAAPHHGHGVTSTRDSLILSYSRYPTLDFEKLDVKMETNKFSLAEDGASLVITGVDEDDFGFYVCQVDLHYIPIPPAPQNLHKAVTVELRKRISV